MHGKKGTYRRSSHKCRAIWIGAFVRQTAISCILSGDFLKRLPAKRRM